MNLSKPTVCALALGLLFSAGQGLSQSPLTLKFGVYSADKPTDVYDKFAPILEGASAHLTKTMGQPVTIELVIGRDYKTTQDQLSNKQIDFARLGAASYVLVKKRAPQIQILAVELEQGKKIISGSIFVRKDSAIRSAADLKGKSFAFGDRDSTLGRYLPQKWLSENGLHRKDLSKFDYLDRHDKVCAAVLAGEFDAGAAKTETFLKYKGNTPGLEEIAQMQATTKPWIAREGMDPKLSAELVRYLMGLKDPALLKQFGATGFTTGADEDYQDVRDILKFGDLFEANQ